MRKFALIAAGAGMLVLSLAVMNLTQGLQTADAEAGAVTLVAIDTTTAGNDDTSLGTIDPCASISVDETLVFDLVVQGVDPADRIGGYQIDIDYDPTVISVDSVVDVDAAGSTPPNNVTILSRIDSSGGVGFLSVSDFTTNPNSMTLSAIDGTAVPPYPDMHEAGEGVLARVTITGIASGTSALDVGGVLGGADGINPGSNPPGPTDVIINSGTVAEDIPVTTVQDGQIVVGGDCVAATDTPTPTTEPSATATTGPTPTATTGPTPTATTGPTPTASTGPTATAAPTATATATPTAAPTAGTATPGSLPPTGGDTGSGGSATVWLLALSALGLVLIAASWGAIKASRRELS